MEERNKRDVIRIMGPDIEDKVHLLLEYTDNLKDIGENSLSNIVILISKFIILYMTIPILNGVIIFCMKFIDL